MFEAVNTSFLLASLNKIFIEGFWTKVILGTGSVVLSVLFDFTVWSGIQALLVLIFFHFVLGIMDAVRVGGWHSITLQKMNATPVKVVVYSILISSAYLTERALGGVDILLDQMIIGFFAVAEFREIIKHAANLGYVLPKSFVDKIKGLLGESKESDK